MSLSKPYSFLTRLTKTLTDPKRHAPPSLLRLLSFATPEEAAAERRNRKRRLRIEPPLRHAAPHPTPTSQPSPQQNPNSTKLPEPVSALSGNRLNLHNKILTLIRENDLKEASLLTRHSVYSNARPTIYTCNAVMTALLRQSQYADLLSLHRFITQAGIAPNLITHNLLLNVYLDCRKVDLALEQYKNLINEAPFNPSPTTYRILIRGLVSNGDVDKAVEIKDDMEKRGLGVDATVYSYLMLGKVKEGDVDGVFALYDELKGKMCVEESDDVLEGVLCGNLMKGWFLRGMDKEAMACYERYLGENSGVQMSAVAYNDVLEALRDNGRLGTALELFERMKAEHNPPKTLSVNLGSYNVVVEGYCKEKRLDEAIEVFESMGEKGCYPDVLSYNSLIDRLCENGRLTDAEKLFEDMGEKKVSPDEHTHASLMDACLKEDRHDDAARYFKTMVEAELKPNLEVYNRLVEGLVRVGKIDEAKSFFDLMFPKLKMNDDAYKFIANALFDAGKHDEVLKIVDRMLREDPNDFTEEVEEFVKEGLRKEGREDEVMDIKLKIEKEKAEAAAKAAEEVERAKASARAAVASLLPLKLLGNKNDEIKDELNGAIEVTETTSISGNSEDEREEDTSENEGNVVAEQVIA